MSHSPSTTSWHALDAETVYEIVHATAQGLSEDEASARLTIHGANTLPSNPGPSWWLIGVRQLKSPLIYILILAAVISATIGHLNDAIFIAGVLVLNALIGGYQEWRAERSTRALQKLLKVNATVLRDGQVCEIEAHRVVPGDLVCLESGNRVPADLRLLQTHALEVDESLLTGESLAVVKDPHWQGQDNTPLAEQKNMACAGSVITRGRAKGIVVATGINTHVGRLALDVIDAQAGHPL